ncbi:MAG: PorP/SprF family type IX secretion system membrane protein [Bacteroidia bacterium]
MNKRFLLSVGFVLALTSGRLFAQDPHFSQYNETPIYVNPALSGVAYDTRVNLNYKSQWKSVSVPYKSYGASAEFSIGHKKLHKRSYMTTGLMAYNDVAGTSNFSSLHLGALLGVVIKSGNYGKISGGLMGAFDQRTINGDKLTWDSQYNGYKYDKTLPGEQIPNAHFIYADFGAGFNYHYAKSEKYISAADGHRFDIGLSAYHVNVPYYSFYGNTGENQKIRIVQHANFVIALPQVNSNIIPSYIVMVQGPSIEVNAGLMYRLVIADASVHTGSIKPMAFSFGGYYRLKDAFIPQVLFEYGHYAIGASYDVNLSALTPTSKTKGGVEVAIRYNFNPSYGVSVGNTTNPRPTPVW